jgi:hypothetical protein
MTEPQEAELFLDAELAIKTRINALDRVINDYIRGDTTITGVHLFEVLTNASKIEEYLLTGTVVDYTELLKFASGS